MSRRAAAVPTGPLKMSSWKQRGRDFVGSWRQLHMSEKSALVDDHHLGRKIGAPEIGHQLVRLASLNRRFRQGYLGMRFALRRNMEVPLPIWAESGPTPSSLSS